MHNILKLSCLALLLTVLFTGVSNASDDDVPSIDTISPKCIYQWCKSKENDVSLEQHVEDKHKVQNNYFICNPCDQRFESAKDVIDHIQNHYKCDQCDFAAARKGDLTVHKRTHTGEKPYKCDQCDFAAASISNLTKHKRTHTGEKPFKCDQCDYAAATSSNLTRHKRTHTGEKPFKCDQCDYAAAISSNLTRHKKKHQDNTEQPPAKKQKTS